MTLDFTENKTLADAPDFYVGGSTVDFHSHATALGFEKAGSFPIGRKQAHMLHIYADRTGALLSMNSAGDTSENVRIHSYAAMDIYDNPTGYAEIAGSVSPIFRDGEFSGQHAVTAINLKDTGKGLNMALQSLRKHTTLHNPIPFEDSFVAAAFTCEEDTRHQVARDVGSDWHSNALQQITMERITAMPPWVRTMIGFEEETVTVAYEAEHEENLPQPLPQKNICVP